MPFKIQSEMWRTQFIDRFVRFCVSDLAFNSCFIHAYLCNSVHLPIHCYAFFDLGSKQQLAQFTVQLTTAWKHAKKKTDYTIYYTHGIVIQILFNKTQSALQIRTANSTTIRNEV